MQWQTTDVEVAQRGSMQARVYLPMECGGGGGIVRQAECEVEADAVARKHLEAAHGEVGAGARGCEYLWGGGCGGGGWSRALVGQGHCSEVRGVGRARAWQQGQGRGGKKASGGSIAP